MATLLRVVIYFKGGINMEYNTKIVNDKLTILSGPIASGKFLYAKNHYDYDTCVMLGHDLDYIFKEFHQDRVINKDGTINNDVYSNNEFLNAIITGKKILIDYDDFTNKLLNILVRISELDDKINLKDFGYHRDEVYKIHPDFKMVVVIDSDILERTSIII